MTKTFKRIKGQSKYLATWNVSCYENGEHTTTKTFPIKNEAETYIKELLANGYEEEKSILSWK